MYSEDLSWLRPSYEAPEKLDETSEVERTIDYSNTFPASDVTAALNATLDSIDVLRQGIRYIDGFTIQVYSGISSTEARRTRGKIYSLLPESDPKLSFDEPSFKVKIGKYYSRMEAQKLYAQLKEEFPNAIIIPERIYIQ